MMPNLDADAKDSRHEYVAGMLCSQIAFKNMLVPFCVQFLQFSSTLAELQKPIFMMAENTKIVAIIIILKLTVDSNCLKLKSLQTNH